MGWVSVEVEPHTHTHTLVKEAKEGVTMREDKSKTNKVSTLFLCAILDGIARLNIHKNSFLLLLDFVKWSWPGQWRWSGNGLI